MGGDGPRHAKPKDTPAPAPDWPSVKAFLQSDPSLIQADAELLTALGLRVHAANVVDFIPPAVFRDMVKHPLT
jgi:uncharacterized protein YigA (DUF484 family)